MSRTNTTTAARLNLGFFGLPTIDVSICYGGARFGPTVAMSQDSVEPADPAVLGLGRAVERLVISLPSSQVPDDFALTVIFHWNGYSDHLHLADL